MLRDIIKIYAEDGKEFSGTNIDDLFQERNAYESDLALKKEKEEAERKAKEEKDRELRKLRQEKLDEIRIFATKFSELIRTYEKETGMKLIGTYHPKSEIILIKEVQNKLDYALDNLITDVINIIFSNK